MKIIQIIFSLSSGGAERVVVNLSNELSKNHEITICTILNDNQNNSFYKKNLQSKIKHICLGHRRGLNLRSFYQVYKIIKKLKPDVVHLHLNTLIYGFIPSLLFKSTKFIHTIHNIAQKEVGLGCQKNINRFFYKNECITPVSISDTCELSLKSFYNLKKVLKIENGVPSIRLTEDIDRVKVEVNGYRKNKRDIIFIHIARFSQQKNQDLLIDSFNWLIANGYQVKLLVIGHGFDTIKGRQLKSKAINGIYFLGEKSNPTDYLATCDCFILSSLWEGMPMTLLEALSCGLPSVGTPAGGIPDIINNDSLGLISNDFSITNFTTTIIKMIELIKGDKIDKVQILNEFKTKYSVDICSQRYQELYSETNDN